MSGMLSMRHRGASISEITGIYLGKAMLQVMRVFSVILLVMVGVVFSKGPAGLLAMLTPENLDANFWLWVIIGGGAAVVLGAGAVVLERVEEPGKGILSSMIGANGNLAELLRIENYSKGVFARETKGGVEVEMYIAVAYGLKITEVVSEVQKKVKYVLEKTLDIKFKSINVFVKGIKSV